MRRLVLQFGLTANRMAVDLDDLVAGLKTGLVRRRLRLAGGDHHRIGVEIGLPQTDTQ